MISLERKQSRCHSPDNTTGQQVNQLESTQERVDLRLCYEEFKEAKAAMALAQAASSRSRQDSELSPVISSMGPSSRQQTAHRPAPGRSSRTPKRIKATPPTRPLGACTSTTANNISEDTRAGNSDTVMKDGVKPPKLHLKSPWKSPAWSGEREPRRKRENTVPMVSAQRTSSRD